MAGGIDWFRWHHGSVTDPKFQLVARKAGARLGDVVTLWAFMLEKASAEVERGTIGQLDLETIDFLLGAEEGTAARILDAMTGRGLIVAGRITKWEERQPKREREGDDTAAERKRRQREIEAAVRQAPPSAATDGDVTPSHATSHQKKPRGEKSREEEKKPLASIASDKPTRRARGDRFAPDDFEVTADMQAWAAENAPLVDWQRETERFVDWEFKSPRTDWARVWRTWMRRAQDAAVEKGVTRAPVAPQSFAAADREAGMQRWEQMTGRIHPDRQQQPGVVIDLPPNQLAIGGRS